MKENLEMVELDKSDMWSYGVLYYYLSSGKMPESDEEGLINIKSLSLDQKNRNIIGRCLDYSVETRLDLQNVKLESVDEDLLGQMLREKRDHEQEMREIQNMRSDEDENEEELLKDRKIMFKNRKKPIFKHYNKIIIESSTNNCRICCKLLFSIIVYVILFFGIFVINGGYGVIRSNFFNPVTLMVPYNYGTALREMTILTTDGQYILDNYVGYSYEQYTVDLRCAENRYSE